MLRFLVISMLFLISCSNIKGTIVNKYYEPKHKYIFITDGTKKVIKDDEDYVFIIIDKSGRHRVEVSKRKWHKYKVGEKYNL